MIVAAAAFGIGLVSYLSYKLYKRVTSLTVIQVDTTLLDNIKDEQMLQQLFLLAQESYGNMMKEGKASHRVAATLYSLFKQAKMGDAEEFEKNKEKD